MRCIPNQLRVTQLLSCLFILLALASCKKEDNKVYKAEIISFTTKDAIGEPIKGALTEKNEIVFYWPPEQNLPDSIAPVIKISEGSTVKPASGTKVAFNNQISFTVTSQTGEAKAYKIKVMPYDPEPFINSVGFSRDNLYRDPTSEFYEYNLIEIENVGINEGLTEKNKKIELFLVDNNDKEFPLKMVNKEDVPAAQLNTYLRWLESQKATFFVSLNKIEIGVYKKIKLVYNNHVVYYDKNINVKQRK